MPALASAAQVVNSGWPGNEWENVARAFIAAFQGTGQAVNEESNTALVGSLADGLDLVAASAERPQADQVGTGNDSVQSGSAKLSPRELASKHGVDAGALRQRLDRWRHDHDAGYVEVSNAARNEPKYLYDEASVMLVIEALKTKPVGRKRATDKQQKKV